MTTSPPDHRGPAAPPRLVGTIWLLLFINILGFIGESVLPIPRTVGQMITMGSLVVAFGLALLLNPRIQVRPNAYLLLLTVLLIVAIAATLKLQSGYGSLFRVFRLTVFVATLWLLSRWWQGELRFARFHLRALILVLLTVLMGVLVAPGAALGDGLSGRLAGVLWPVPPTQVGHYGAVAGGLAILLWLTRDLGQRTAALIAVPALTMLLLSHTRTALAGLIAGLAVAGLTLAWMSARTRRSIVGAISIGSFVALMFHQEILDWLRRGQEEEQLTSLTGRKQFWAAFLNEERTLGERLFGVGLTDKSYLGLPIDSSWLAAYHDLGLVGVGVIIVMLVALLVTALLRPPSRTRACALFLIAYCLVASYTEVGLSDASPYLLNLAVAASLLAAPSRPSPDAAAGRATASEQPVGRARNGGGMRYDNMSGARSRGSRVDDTVRDNEE